MAFLHSSRGILFAGGKVLLAHQKGSGNAFLPGGHIGPGEPAELALIREIKEEIGITATVKRFVVAVEASWSENGEPQHEINLLFEVSIPDLDSTIPPASKESHLTFLWALPEELEACNLLPSLLVSCLALESRSMFLGVYASLRATQRRNHAMRVRRKA